MHELIWFLVPAAALGGWFAAKRTGATPGHRFMGADYLGGLNYLLNEQPDKAIDAFVRTLEVTAETFETHLVLGNLFRKRGEVDRAIRVHQNLLAKHALSDDQHGEVLLELGRDYQRAGLLDRAEGLFSELLQRERHVGRVLPLLLDIYQQEKDWESAIRTASRMHDVDNRPSAALIAQFLCEMAEDARRQGATERARSLLKQALDRDAGCARSSILLGDLEREEGRHESALLAYAQIESQDRELLPEVLDSMYTCHRELGHTESMVAYLHRRIAHGSGTAPVVLLADILAGQRRGDEACAFIVRLLTEHPSVRGLAKFVELRLAGCQVGENETLAMLGKLIMQLQKGRPAYLCRVCGFAGKRLHWRCPGCRHWDTVRPVIGIEGY